MGYSFISTGSGWPSQMAKRTFSCHFVLAWKVARKPSRQLGPASSISPAVAAVAVLAIVLLYLRTSVLISSIYHLVRPLARPSHRCDICISSKSSFESPLMLEPYISS